MRNMTRSFIVGVLMLALLTPGMRASAATFQDVPESAEFYDAVEMLVELGALSTSTGKFNPRNELTRGQAAKILAIVFELPYESIKTSKFKDVPTTAEFSPYIAALAEANIINGYADGTYRPNAKLSRGQMAKIIANIIELEPGDIDAHYFPDVPASNGYAPFVNAMYEADITQGKTDGTFGVNDKVKRSQFALFVERAIIYDIIHVSDPNMIKTVGFTIGFDEETGSFVDVPFDKVEAVRLSDGQVFPMTRVLGNMYELITLDGAPYLINHYLDGALDVQYIAKKKAFSDEEESFYVDYTKADEAMFNELDELVISDMFGIANILGIEEIHETYTLLEGNASSIRFEEAFEPDYGYFMQVVIGAPGTYVLEVAVKGGDTITGEIEVIEYDGDYYCYYPEFGA